MNDSMRHNRSRFLRWSLLASIVLFLAPPISHGAVDLAKALSQYDVTQGFLGQSPIDSMPIGNGDIGLNVWTEQSGDLCFYISKTDAWSEENAGAWGLLKLGRIRVSITPNPFPGYATKVTLHLHDGYYDVVGGSPERATSVRVWVDANRPVIHVDCQSTQPVSIKAAYETWRTQQVGDISPDVTLPAKDNHIVWYHHNTKSANPQVVNYTFGASMQGEGFNTTGDAAIVSKEPATKQSISIAALTVHPSSPEEWRTKLDAIVKDAAAVSSADAQAQHEKWWHDFWNRSWIFINGDDGATTVTRGATLQRFVTACSGRGAHPIKFNGSIFTVNHDAFLDGRKDAKTGLPEIIKTNPDYRRWGGNYWFQNTRAMYWSRLSAGDFDLMQPLFKMYQDMLPTDAALVKEYYGHDGGYFAECMPFYGGLNKLTPDKGKYVDHYFTPIIELSTMMTDYYDYTQDDDFARKTLLPVARAGLTFFDQHFKRDADGKLLLDPDNAVESYWRVHDPMPDVAGLTYLLQRLLALPDTVTTPEDRAAWQKLQAIIPPIPRGDVKGKTLLLPYSGPQTVKRGNTENPELYAIFPFRIFGVGKPDLQIARDTFEARTYNDPGCWMQDEIQAAFLGNTSEAKQYEITTFSRQDPYMTFPAFWKPGHDFDPDEDNGGNGETGLQKMLMQCEGKKILLLPAWPKEWEAEFQLKAPFKTTVTGHVKDGKMVELKVEPESRRGDVEIFAGEAGKP